MTLQFHGVRTLDAQGCAVQGDRTYLDPVRARAEGRLTLALKRKRGLSTREEQIDIRQYLGVQQRAVELALGIVDAIPATQIVEAVLLAGVPRACECKRVNYPATRGDTSKAPVEQRKLVVDEANVEGGVMDHQLGTRNEIKKLRGDLGENWLVGQKIVADAVNLERARIDLTLGIDVTMEVPAAQATIEQLHAADFDDAMPGGRF